MNTLKPNLDIYGACDPSLGKEGKHGDYSVILTLARDRNTGTIYVIDADIEKRTPHKLVKDILEYCHMRNYTKFVFEANQFQEVLVGMIKDEGAIKGIYPPIEELHNTTDKVARIQSLQALINGGKLQFSKKHTELLIQLKYFPKGPHDDGPDALEMAVRICKSEIKQNRVIILDLNGKDIDYDKPIQDPNERDYGSNYRLDDGEDD